MRLKKYLSAENQWDENQEQKLKETAEALVEAAVQEYLNYPLNTPESMFDYLYANLPEALATQREEARLWGRKNHD